MNQLPASTSVLGSGIPGPDQLWCNAERLAAAVPGVTTQQAYDFIAGRLGTTAPDQEPVSWPPYVGNLSGADGHGFLISIH